MSWFLGWGDVAIPGPRGGFFTVYILAPITGAIIGAGVYKGAFIDAAGKSEAQRLNGTRPGLAHDVHPPGPASARARGIVRQDDLQTRLVSRSAWPSSVTEAGCRSIRGGRLKRLGSTGRPDEMLLVKPYRWAPPIRICAAVSRLAFESRLADTFGKFESKCG